MNGQKVVIIDLEHNLVKAHENHKTPGDHIRDDGSLLVYMKYD